MDIANILAAANTMEDDKKGKKKTAPDPKAIAVANALMQSKMKAAMDKQQPGTQAVTSKSTVTPQELEKFTNWAGEDPKNWEKGMNSRGAMFDPINLDDMHSMMQSHDFVKGNIPQRDIDKAKQNSMIWQKDLSDGVLSKARELGITDGEGLKNNKDILWKAGLSKAGYDNPADQAAVTDKFNTYQNGVRGQKFWDSHAQLYNELRKTEQDNKQAAIPTASVTMNTVR